MKFPGPEQGEYKERDNSKPVGQGKVERTLVREDNRLAAFIEAVQNTKHPYRI